MYIIITSLTALPTSSYFHLHSPNLKSTYSYFLETMYQSSNQPYAKDKPLSNSDYSNFLKIKYNSSLNTNLKWPPLSSELYIPLAAVEMEGVSLKDADEFTKFTLNDSPEQILKRKRQIIFDDLLKPTQHSDGLKFVLVEGAPGIGKSTLAKEICQRWSTNPTAHNHLKQFSLVILVQLRDQRVQHATTLYDLLPEDPNTNMNEIERQLNKTYGQNVLWILDGFDELPRDQRQEGSLYCRLIEGDMHLETIYHLSN